MNSGLQLNNMQDRTAENQMNSADGFAVAAPSRNAEFARGRNA